MKATFAGGCFWCLVPPFEDIKGVKEIVSGESADRESVQIDFDEKKVSYKELLDIFWRQIDPTDEGGQFYDRGIHYKTAIFYHNQEQKEAAEKSKKDIQKHFEEEIATEILSFEDFEKAAEHHQNFHKKNPFRYKMYKKASGRERFLKQKWS